jgi:hypothetical protein
LLRPPPVNPRILSLRPRSAQAQAEEHAGIVPGRPMGLLSTMAMSMLLRGLDAIITVHGFRSSFRDWAAEAGVEFSVAEQCLARQQRDPLLSANLDVELRRPVVASWASFVCGETGDHVVCFAGPGRDPSRGHPDAVV